MPKLLTVRDLVVEVPARKIKIIDGVTFSLEAGQTLGLVGESGCGKSMTCFAVARALPRGIAQTGGTITLEGEGPRSGKDKGPSIAMIFQDPTSSLNPVHTIGYYLESALYRHQGLKGNDARLEAMRLLERVGIDQAKSRLRSYPHQFSGGMNQRVMIAHALAAKPQLLIADEPTTALDVTTQAQILHLLEELRAETSMALLIVSHDLGVIARLADRAAVMYCGKIVETAPVGELLGRAAHPYARALIDCMPTINPDDLEPPIPIPGTVPLLDNLPAGCYYHPRCSRASDRCIASLPAPANVGPLHEAACYHPVSA
ncbi:ABC transporter ATP-binding protein [Rhizobium rhizogenes]|uniref:Oligopeptide ABC transporter ATP-binding protein n=1 Tax=Rhizobium rhizogenes NBRC 13257 TaxID=1220581 RepID=A0AA87Q4U7_RHIRH|nr:ABC transporter ATP-binding protein [Rhizobium rhizogenes]NTG71370.1 ABC transporter ATP-binding protein [Rhizobium rhizogenes]TRB05106.1 ABC transporter ATP-binding protein [Rhizobium rhizogenes]TRB39365.1 ABC transporter ATP-binding protein [Rhizobium rhizogenes]TRB54641.1 ABC transporter ATP-binding protein [Rhizobium rhizogenes]GAJ95550.1 putative oligopeptide ABC transporter ATP-binding protein [Rhizobium rhizogenes NBRC 13257]